MIVNDYEIYIFLPVYHQKDNKKQNKIKWEQKHRSKVANKWQPDSSKNKRL
jgi:hypothetical protein